MAQYYTLVTNIGTQKIANSIATGEKLNITSMKIGDGGGSYYEPSVKQTALKNVVHEIEVNSIKISDKENRLTVEGIIPANVGGFYIREVGIFDADGDLIAIGKYSETYKAATTEGTAKEIIIKLVIEVENAESVNISVNANMSIATQEDLKEVENKIDSVKQLIDSDFDNMKSNLETVTNELEGMKETIENVENDVIQNINSSLNSKANKDGTLQNNLNADMLDGKHLSDLASKVHNHDTLTGGNANMLDLSAPNDWAGLEKKNNVNIETWWGVSFSNACDYGSVPQGGVGVAMDVREGRLMTKGDIRCEGRVYVQGQDLFQSVSNGKSAIANAITGKGVNANSSMTFEQLVTAIKSIAVQKEIHKEAHWMEVPSMYLPDYSIGGAYRDENNWWQDGSRVWFFRCGYYNEYDIANKRWIANKSYSGGCAKAGNFIYGLTGGTSPKFNTFNLSDGTSTSVDCKYASYKGTGTRVATNTGIHVLGGSTGRSVADYISSHQKIIFGTGAIASRSSLPEKNRGPKTCADEQYNIYCIGGTGYDGRDTYAVNKFGRFNEATNTWTYFPTDKGVRFDCMACRNNIVYLFYEDTITIYNIVTGTYSIKGTKKGIKVWGSTMFMSNGILHITGGEFGKAKEEADSQATWAFVE